MRREGWATRLVGWFGGGAEAVTHMFRGDLLALPVHAGGLAVVDLHAVHADVALTPTSDRESRRRAA